MLLLCGCFSACAYKVLILSCKDVSLSLAIFAFRLEYFTVKPLISILIRSHFRPESVKSAYFPLNEGIFSRKAAI